MKRNIKTLLGIVLLILFILLSAFVCVKKGVFNLSLKPENNIHERIIQARLLETGLINLNHITKLYEGTFTFKNLNDGVLHTNHVCLDSMNDVKINGIYDLPENYYVVRIPDPSSSPFTSGCGIMSLQFSSFQDMDINTPYDFQIYDNGKKL